MPPEPERIIVSKTDEPTLVAEKLIDTDSKTVIFVVPEDCELAASKTNFKLLKREAEVLKKKILIESPDQSVLDMAQAAGLQIVDAVSVTPEEEDEVVKVKISTPTRQKKVLAKRVQEPFIGEPVRPSRKRITISRRSAFWMIGVAAVIALALYVGLAVLPKASISIESKKEAWQFNQNIIVDTTISAPNLVKLKVPGQLFIQKNTTTLKRPATGTKYLERKSQGLLTIYNAYSSKPQGLVASTRFVTASGVVFRLVSAVTVPGANIQSGKIIPSSITATVVADKAGSSGDVGPTDKLLIPGFVGSPKYQAFYGELKEGTTGGLVGQSKVPTDADLASAKDESAKAVESAVRNQASSQMPDGFTVIPGAVKFVITKQDVNQVIDKDGNFSVTTSGQLTQLAFREKDILTVIHEKITGEKGDQYQESDEALTYPPLKGIITPTTGQLGLPVSYTTSLSQKVDLTGLKDQMKGQSEEGLKGIIYALPGVASAKISLWPFWVQHVPLDPAKITIMVQ